MRALVTGASRGIGRELALQLAARGDDVIATARKVPSNAQGLSWEGLDVADPASITALAARIAPPIDLLVCNAGIYEDKGMRLDDGFPPDLWAKTFAVNVTGVFLCIQAFLPHLAAAQGAKVAIISSQMGSAELAGGGSYVYRASKAAALNLGRNLATDLAPRGIAVGVYHPGWVRTDMGTEAAAIGVEASARGLIARFEALGPDSTGCFETWDGRAHPY